MERLTGANFSGMPTMTIAYEPNGNILSKTGLGSYGYDSNKKHAVVSVENTSALLPMTTQSLTYNDFGKVQSIVDGNYSMSLVYGPDQERWKTELRNGQNIVRTTLYGDGYERITENGTTRHFYYLEGGILCVKQDGQPDQFYYVNTDHQGSVLSIVDANGSNVFEADYDAWGKQTVTLNTIGFHRGYTGHEMMPEFGLINMNGRLYNPDLGRFLAPDNYVQTPDFSQNFNRYTYCLNNPLKYTDPSGEFWNLIVGAAIGGIFNWAFHGFNFNASGLGYFAVGALAGAVSTGMASGIDVALAGGNFWAGAAGLTSGISSTGFFAGAATGASAGFASSFVCTAGNSWVEGKSFGTGFWDGLESAGIGALTNGIAGGLFGGIDALEKGTNFWTGTAKLNLNGAYSCSGCRPSGLKLNEQTITGKYVGKFEGVNVYETKTCGSLIDPEINHYGAMTVPERGIIAGEGVFTSGKMAGKAMMQHEFGHILQYRKVGSLAYWSIIAPESFTNATLFPSSHKTFWTETWANYLSKGYFGRGWLGLKFGYPVENISSFNMLRITAVKTLQLINYRPRGFF